MSYVVVLGELDVVGGGASAEGQLQGADFTEYLPTSLAEIREYVYRSFDTPASQGRHSWIFFNILRHLTK